MEQWHQQCALILMKKFHQAHWILWHRVSVVGRILHLQCRAETFQCGCSDDGYISKSGVERQYWNKSKRNCSAYLLFQYFLKQQFHLELVLELNSDFCSEISLPKWLGIPWIQLCKVGMFGRMESLQRLVTGHFIFWKITRTFGLLK